MALVVPPESIETAECIANVIGLQCGGLRRGVAGATFAGGD